MKNWKKYAALAGVVLLLVVFCLPMVFALKGDFDLKLFMASLFGVLFVAVMGYVIWMLFRVLNKKKEAPEESSGIRNVIFDVGKVLVEFDVEGYLKTFDFPEEKKNRIAQATFYSKIWDERDRGLKKHEEYVDDMVALAPEYEEDIRKVMDGSYKTIIRYPYTETWVRYLKSKGYGVYILSNYSEYMFEHTAKKELTFLKDTDGDVFSYTVKLMKPEAEIYQTLLDRYGLAADQCVFIDDRAENCDGARAVGIQAIEFKSFKQATEELEKLGVK